MSIAKLSDRMMARHDGAAIAAAYFFPNPSWKACKRRLWSTPIARRLHSALWSRSGTGRPAVCGCGGAGSATRIRPTHIQDTSPPVEDMAKTDIAQRVYDHTWKLDPIIRSLLDTDFYKLLMLQMIWGLYSQVNVTFSLINRTRSVRVAEEIDERELRDQLDHARTLRFAKKEMIWLAGNTFYGRAQIFDPKFLAWLADFSLPEYALRRENGQFVLTFAGPWTHTTMWEIPALAIISELRSRAALKRYGQFTLDVVYARAKAKLWSKVERLRQLPDLKISDFGTRRRHSFLWQRWCVEALKEGLGDAFIGSSNVLLAMDADLEAIGTNAHELPMVLAALAPNDEALRQAPYQVFLDWKRYYGGNLLIVLPDTFGTTAFLREAPDWLADWTGFRPDSAPPIEGGEMIIDWWRQKG